MRSKKVVWAVASILITMTVLAISIVWYLNSTVAVSARIVDNKGNAYAYKPIKLGGIETMTDHNGQFFIHVHRGINYRLENHDVSFKLRAWSEKNINFSGKNIKLGMSVSTVDNKVELTTRNNVAYLDDSYDINYDNKSSKLTGKNYLDLKTGDKVIVMPTASAPLGMAGQISKYSEDDGYFRATIKPLHVEKVLKHLIVNSGQIKANKLVELKSSSNSSANFEPTAFKVKGEISDDKAPFVISIPKKSGDTDNKDRNIDLDLKNTLNFGGTFTVEANFDFLNSKKSKAKIVNKITYRDYLEANMALNKDDKEKTTLDHTYHLQQFIIPEVPFITIPIGVYYGGTASLQQALQISGRASMVSTLNGTTGIVVNSKKTKPVGEIQVNGKMSGRMGIKSGVALSAFPTNADDNLVEANLKNGLELDGSVKAKMLLKSNLSPSGSYLGKGDFVTSIEATSPLLNRLSDKKDFTGTMEISRINLFNVSKSTSTHSKKAPEKKKTSPQHKTNKANTLNIVEIKQNNFSTAVGTWFNSAGDSFTIDNNGRISGNTHNISKIYINDGIVKSGDQEYNFTSSILNGVLKTQAGTDPLPTGPVDYPALPMYFLPKGVALSNIENGNFSKPLSDVDKIVLGPQASDQFVYMRKVDMAKSSSQTSLPDDIPSDLIFYHDGAWSNKITIQSNGDFSGVFEDYDSNLVTKSKYTGHFTNIKQVSPTEYTFELGSIQSDNSSETETDSGVPIEWTTSAYGLDGGKTFSLYLPAEKMSDLPDIFYIDSEDRVWHDPELKKDPNAILNQYALLNKDKGFSFVEH